MVETVRLITGGIVALRVITHLPRAAQDYPTVLYKNT